MSAKRIKILGCPIDNLSVDEMVKTVEGFIKSKRPHQYVAINADKIVKMRKDPEFREVVRKSDLNIVDGQPLVWLSRLFGKPVKQRYGGLDIMDALAPLSGEKGYRVYYLGAKEEVVKEVVDRYKRSYPDMNLAGWRDGYWSESEEKNIVDNIRESRADILFFAMSSPMKERFLNKYLDEMGVSFAVGVGGAFDILAGKTKRAPKWVQKVGMEWLYRVLQEPGRLWKRYLISNTAFLGIVLREVKRQATLRTKLWRKRYFGGNSEEFAKRKT
jgi:N-acetylglucosaminyldiphosphoundecaprenol N-acetyl-beta-D-mannosaminyltransferase